MRLGMAWHAIATHNHLIPGEFLTTTRLGSSTHGPTNLKVYRTLWFLRVSPQTLELYIRHSGIRFRLRRNQPASEDETPEYFYHPIIPARMRGPQVAALVPRRAIVDSKRPQGTEENLYSCIQCGEDALAGAPPSV